MSPDIAGAEGRLPSHVMPYDKVIAVTGGSGRVGRLLRNVLKNYARDIRVMDLEEPADLHENESWQRVDICDAAALTRALAGVDAIVHLAGFPNERPIEDLLKVNVLGTHNLYEAARQLKIDRIVLGSSNHVTGFYEAGQRVDPADVMRPDSFYGLSKCWNELEAGLYYEKFGIRSFIIRIGNATMESHDPRSDARSRAIWVSPRDLAQLVLIGLQHEDIDCTTVYGISERIGSWWDNSRALSLGYDPQDAIAGDLVSKVPADEGSAQVSASTHFQGGRFCAKDHDGVIRRRVIRG